MYRVMIIFLVARMLFVLLSTTTAKYKSILETESLPPEKRRRLELKIYRGKLLTKVVDIGSGIYILLEIISTILKNIS